MHAESKPTQKSRSVRIREAAWAGDIQAIIQCFPDKYAGLRVARSIGPKKEAQYKREITLRLLSHRADGMFPSTPEEGGLGCTGVVFTFIDQLKHTENAGLNIPTVRRSTGEEIVSFLKIVEGWPSEDTAKD